MLDQHETRVLLVLQQLREHSLNLSPSKLSFLQRSKHYLGHIFSSKGVLNDSGQCSPCMDQTPNTKGLKSLLVFARYYCRFVKDYFKIVKSHPATLQERQDCILLLWSVLQFQRSFCGSLANSLSASLQLLRISTCTLYNLKISYILHRCAHQWFRSSSLPRTGGGYESR